MSKRTNNFLWTAIVVIVLAILLGTPMNREVEAQSSVTFYLPFGPDARTSGKDGVRVSRTGRLYESIYIAAGLAMNRSEYHGQLPGHPNMVRGAIDFQLPSGTDILASADGVVTNQTNSCQVVVRHADGSVAYYLHLSASLVSDGEPVSRGDVIGRSGNTCNSRGPHLHFALWSGGREVPVQFADQSVQAHGGVVRPSRSGQNGFEFLYVADSVPNQPPPNPAYNYEYVSQTVPSGVRFSGNSFEMEFRLRNTGTETWRKGVVYLGTDQPQDRAIAFYSSGASGWISNNRITMVENQVAPGDIGTFRGLLIMPRDNGTYREDFRLVADGITWMTQGSDLWFETTVERGTPSSNCASPNTTFCDVPTDHYA